MTLLSARELIRGKRDGERLGCAQLRVVAEGIGHGWSEGQVPVLVHGPGLGAHCLGRRDSFADLGQSMAAHPRLRPLDAVRGFLEPHGAESA